MNTDYKSKYLKYKLKYLELKNYQKPIINLDFDNEKKNKNIICTKFDITKNQMFQLICIIKKYFEQDILNKLKDIPRPLDKLYGDIVERNLGRFEIVPPEHIMKQIYDILNKSSNFVLFNKLARDEIIRLTGEDVTEELCLLPVQPNVSDGNFHRDIFVKSPEIFNKPTFYITHLIYLDDKSATEYCLYSQTNPDNDPEKYEKIIIKPSSDKMVLFDGRIIHRGLGNKSSKTRYAIYISYYAKSYVDEESILPKLFN